MIMTAPDSPAAKRGIDLLDEAIARIEADPARWDQEAWRCKSGCCLAGHIAEAAGGTWAYAPGRRRSHYMVAEPGDRRQDVVTGTDGRQIIAVAARAERLTGFRFIGDEDLFAASHTLAGLRRLAAAVRAGPGTAL